MRWILKTIFLLLVITGLVIIGGTTFSMSGGKNQNTDQNTKVEEIRKAIKEKGAKWEAGETEVLDRPLEELCGSLTIEEYLKSKNLTMEEYLELKKKKQQEKHQHQKQQEKAKVSNSEKGGRTK